VEENSPLPRRQGAHTVRHAKGGPESWHEHAAEQDVARRRIRWLACS
jgi:hypothetical protein